MSHTKNNCDHPTEQVISTGLGKFCMHCGQIIGSAVAHKKIIHHKTPRTAKVVSDIRPVAKKSPTVKIKTASIRPSRSRIG